MLGVRTITVGVAQVAGSFGPNFVSVTTKCTVNQGTVKKARFWHIAAPRHLKRQECDGKKKDPSLQTLFGRLPVFGLIVAQGNFFDVHDTPLNVTSIERTDRINGQQAENRDLTPHPSNRHLSCAEFKEDVAYCGFREKNSYSRA
jgi:hypothetical protein